MVSRQSHGLRRTLIGLSALLVVVGCILGLRMLIKHFIVGPRDIESLAEVERRINFIFPPGTTLVAAKYELGFSPVLIAVVEMEPHDLEELFDLPLFGGTTTIDERLLKDNSYFADQNCMPEWRPESQAEFIAAQYWDQRRRHMLILQGGVEEPGTGRVYVVWTAF